MSDTGSIRPEERFDEDRVAAYLRSVLPEIDGDLRFSQFHGGKANLTYLATWSGGEVVLRRPPLGPVAPGAHDMAREYRVLSRLWRGYDRAPRAFHLCEDEAVMGAPFVVMERRHGTVVREAWPDSFTDDVRRRVAESLVDALADLHLVDAGSVGLEDLGRPDGFVGRQVEGWSDRWRRARTRPVPAMERVAAVLDAAVPTAPGSVILHNDFKLDNVVLGPGGDVEAVLDWDMSTRGDPLVDVGTAIAYWPAPDDPITGVFGAGAPHLTPYLDRTELATRYAARTGFDVTNLSFYVGLAYFRIAVIVEQIFARYAAGQTHDERFAGLGDLTPILADAAERALA